MIQEYEREEEQNGKWVNLPAKVLKQLLALVGINKHKLIEGKVLKNEKIIKVSEPGLHPTKKDT